MKKVDLCIEKGKIPTHDSLIEAGLAIDDGKIVSISKSSSLPKADETIDVDGKLILPGIVDSHVHFRDPGLLEKEDFSTGSKAAIAGGVTTVCDMPNTSPPTTNLERFREKKKIGNKKSYADFALHGMLTSSVSLGKELLDEGAVSLKLYPERCDDSIISKITNGESMVTIHPEDPSFLSEVESFENVDDFIESRPEKAEVSEIFKVLSLISNVQSHFCHITTEESLNTISEAKYSKNISCEVTPHHLFLDRSHLRKHGTIAKTYPPLRSKQDRQKLLSGLRKGLIDIVATDHAPHTREEKEKDMRNAPPGMVGVETSLPLLFTLVKKGEISLYRLVESMCLYPARIFDLKNENGVQKGVLKPGADADIVVLNQDETWKIKGEKLHGKTKFTPFEGKKVEGKPELTLIRGEKVYEKGKILGENGYGKFIPSKK